MHADIRLKLSLTVLQLVTCVVLLQRADAGLDYTPSNTSALAGTEASLHCSVTTSYTDISWFRSPDTSSVRVVNRCVVEAAYEHDYSVDFDGAGRCSLVIVNASAETAETYRCQDNVYAETADATFTVLSSTPIGSQNATVAFEGDHVELSCHVEYFSSATAPVQPTFAWTTSDQTLNVVTNVTNSTHAVTSAVVQVAPGPSTVQPANCTVHFPDCPTNIDIDPTEDLMIGMVLTCSAEGHPEPINYEWTTSLDSTVIVGDEFTLIDEGEYNATCTVYNDITFANGSILTCYNSSTIDVSVALGPIDPCDKPVPCDDSSPFVPNPENCTTYYQCVNTEWILMSCAPGTLFDKYSLQCVLPDSATCQEPCPPVERNAKRKTTRADSLKEYAVCPADFTYLSAVNGCYKLVNHNQDWSTAARRCASLHKDAHLVFINSAEEQTHIANWLTGLTVSPPGPDSTLATCMRWYMHYRFWTGSQRVDPSSFVWKSSLDSDCTSTCTSPMTYSNWRPAQPDNWKLEESCVEFTLDNTNSWNDLACDSYKLCSVCELDLADRF